MSTLSWFLSFLTNSDKMLINNFFYLKILLIKLKYVIIY